MSTKELAKGYEPHDVEKKWYGQWLDNGYFHADEPSPRKPYSIVIPPPNVTGALHMGHALNNTLQDILCRWKRMNGYNVLWMPGTDHAGIATQNVVERQLAAEGKDRHDLGREAFIERVWQWKAESGGQIIGQLKRLGASCDWERERFTMDEGLSKSVRTVFVKLYEDGLIYRDNRLINWCPRCHTALSDIEVEHEEKKGHLWHIRYPVVGQPGRFVTVATTRPETMLGDTAVAVHPEDERYADLHGAKVLLPLVNREIPVVTDDYVDREFGTGVVKITPAHDFNDFEVGVRHGLDKINVFDESGIINAAGHQYEGLDRFAARTKIVEDLEAAGLLEKIDDHGLSVGGCYRCKTVVEPYLSLQWYVKVGPLAEKALAAVKDGRTRILPKQWENTYYDWMENIRDWCISRQIWWGHRIPAWFCDHCGKITVAMEDPSCCSQCGSDELRQETDVLDTWFSSALWPFSTMGWPDQTLELKQFYPTATLVTGFDILFFWVARMMMMGLHVLGEAPFKDVYLHALVRDKHGKKMSKSTGNVIDPLEVIDTYGTDALRFTLIAFAAQGREIKLDEERIEGYRFFINKIWNAARFVLMHVGEDDIRAAGAVAQEVSGLPLIHRWILSRTAATIAEVRAALDGYRFNDAASVLYQFIWYAFCDWYLEWIKPDLFSKEAGVKEQARAVLLRVFETIMGLIHPIIPFVTEEIWSALPGDRPPLMTSPYPQAQESWLDIEAESQVEMLMGVITGIRNIRAEAVIHPSQPIEAVILCPSSERVAFLQSYSATIANMTRLKSLLISDTGDKPDDAASYLFKDMEILVPLKGLVDVEKELDKLARERQKVVAKLAQVSAKLESEKFVSNAPPEVVAKEKEKRAELETSLAKMVEAEQRLRNLG